MEETHDYGRVLHTEVHDGMLRGEIVTTKTTISWSVGNWAHADVLQNERPSIKRHRRGDPPQDLGNITSVSTMSSYTGVLLEIHGSKTHLDINFYADDDDICYLELQVGIDKSRYRF